VNMTSLSSRRLVHVLRRRCNNRSNAPFTEAEIAPTRISHRKWGGHIRLLTTTTQEKSRHVNNEECLPLWGITFSSAVAVLLGGVFVYSTTNNSSSCQSTIEDGFFGSSITATPLNAFLSAAPSRAEEDTVDTSKLEGNGPSGSPNRRKKSSINARRNSAYDVSVQAIQGGRIYMEDEYFVGNGGKFVGVFDGHGGKLVSNFLQKNLYKKVKEQMKRKQWEEEDNPTDDYKPPLSSLVSALRAAFEAVETEVIGTTEMEYMGSTAVAVTIHEDTIDGSRTILSANIGDSRAVLCRSGDALDLTRDHKPSDERERARITAMGEKIEWDNYGKVHRVRNLSLSRAIGDKFAKPAVSPEVEIKMFRIQNDDEFIVLASDGLWDVMSSEQVVKFIKRKTDTLMQGSENDVAKRIRSVRRKNMSRYMAKEALKRGSGDNICVVIVWLKPLEG